LAEDDGGGGVGLRWLFNLSPCVLAFSVGGGSRDRLGDGSIVGVILMDVHTESSFVRKCQAALLTLEQVVWVDSAYQFSAQSGFSAFRVEGGMVLAFDAMGGTFVKSESLRGFERLAALGTLFSAHIFLRVVLKRGFRRSGDAVPGTAVAS
jgi:hypothetical protein